MSMIMMATQLCIHNYKPDGSFLNKTLWIRRKIYCGDYNIWVKQNSKLWSILISILRYIHKHRFCYAKPNQTRRIVPGNRNKQWRNEFKAENSNKDLPEVVNEKHRLASGGCCLGTRLINWASHFLPKMKWNAFVICPK